MEKGSPERTDASNKVVPVTGRTPWDLVTLLRAETLSGEVCSELDPASLEELLELYGYFCPTLARCQRIVVFDDVKRRLNIVCLAVGLGCKSTGISGPPAVGTPNEAAATLECPKPPQGPKVDPKLVVQKGYSNFIEGVAFARQGTMAVTSGVDGVLRVWTLPAGRQLRSLEIPGRSGLLDEPPLVSPDGKTAYLVRSDGRDRHWVQEVDLAGGRIGRRLLDTERVANAVLAPSGKLIVATVWSDVGRHVVAVDPQRSIAPREIAGRDAWLAGFVGEEQVLVVEDAVPKLLSTADGSTVETFAPRASTRAPRRFAASPDAKSFALLPWNSDGGTVDVYQRGRPNPVGVSLKDFTYPNSLCAASNDAFVLGGSSSLKLHGGQEASLLWFGVDGSNTTPREAGNLAGVSALGCDAASGWILAVHGTEMALLEASTGASVPAPLLGHQTPRVVDLAVDEKSGTIAIATRTRSNKPVHLLDARTGYWKQSFETRFGEAAGVVLSKDGSLLLTEGGGRTVSGFSINSGAQSRYDLPDCALSASPGLVASHDRNRVAYVTEILSEEKCRRSGVFGRGSGKSQVFVYDVGSKVALLELPHTQQIHAIALNPDGTRVALGLWTGEIEIWNVDTKRIEATWAAHERSIERLVFSPSGAELAAEPGRVVFIDGTPHAASLDSDKDTRIFDVRTTEERARIPEEGLLDYGPDGKLLFFDRSGDLVAWNRDLAEAAYVAPNLHLAVTAVEFLPSAGVVITGGSEGSIRYSRFATGEPLALIHMVENGQFGADPGSVIVSPTGRFDYHGRLALSGVHFAIGFETLALSQLVDVFYEPFMLSNLLDGLQPNRQLDLSRGFSLPPAVELAGRDADNGNFILEAKTVDRGGGVAEVGIFHNGRRVSTELASKPVRGVVRYEIPLHPGPNTFVAMARADNGIKSFSPRIEAPDMPGQTGQGRLHVVSIGVGSYGSSITGRDRGLTREFTPNAILPNLRFATSDATRIADRLTDGKDPRFREAKKNVLHDVTRRQLLKALDAVAEQASRRDTVMIFLAGHGIARRALRQCEEVNDYYFVTTDYGEVADIPNTAVSATEFLEHISRIPARDVFVILDTCQAGAANNTMLSDVFGALTVLGENAGIHVIAGSLASESAKESGTLSQGVFTHALLDALDCEERPGSELRLSGLEGVLNERINATLSRSGLTQNVLATTTGKDPLLRLCSGS